jgi:hypothetical protein
MYRKKRLLPKLFRSLIVLIINTNVRVTLAAPSIKHYSRMKVEFEIEEKMPDIISEILHSDKWHSMVKDDCNGLQRVVLKDLTNADIAYAEIWKREIHLRPASSGSTYRIFVSKKRVMCEYIGSAHGLLAHALFPKLTPITNLDRLPDGNTEDVKPKTPKPGRVYDRFINDGLPVLPDGEKIYNS